MRGKYSKTPQNPQRPAVRPVEHSENGVHYPGALPGRCVSPQPILTETLDIQNI